MPTVTLNKEVFEQLVGKKLPLEELKDRISMLGTDLEKIEGNQIEVEIFPNRPDMLSEQGFARAFSSFIGIKTGLRKYEVKKSGEKVIIEDSVKEVRPYTACAIIKNLKFDDEKIREVIQIQEKLHVTFGRNRKKLALGIYPLEKITFPITYKAEDPDKIKFRPLETNREMTGKQILSQHKMGREYGHLLEGLNKFPFFIDAKKEILSMPPIINSHLTGKISPETKEVFIECSGFDFTVLNKCLNILVTALAEMGGEIYSLQLEDGEELKTTPNLTPEKKKMDLTAINKLLGINLKEKEAIELLARMGYGFEKGDVLIPAYRADILHLVDLAEDIAIAYGYENFTPEIPQVATIGEEEAFEKFCDKIREILVGLKLLEVKNYHLMTKEELSGKMQLKENIISLKNALGDYNNLRNSLFPSLLKNLKENQHQEYPQNIFEIGRTFSFDQEKETRVRETVRLGIVLCHETTDFTEIRQVLDVLSHSLEKEMEVKESFHPSGIPGRVGEVKIGEEKIGTIGEFHPQVLENWGVAVPVVGMQLKLEKLWELIK